MISDLYKPAEAIARQRKVRLLRQDAREPDEITATLLRGEGYTVERLGLPLGDWNWDVREESWLGQRGYVNVTVERKTLADLRDIVRLDNQLGRARMMLAEEKLGRKTLFIVLIEYSFDRDRKRRWSEQAVRHAKLSMQLGGIKVTECGENEIAEAVDGLYKWGQKLGHSLAGSV